MSEMTSFNITSNIPLPPNTKITFTVNEIENQPTIDENILFYQKNNEKIQNYSCFDFKTGYGIKLLKEQLNLLTTIILEQNKKINYLENELKKRATD